MFIPNTAQGVYTLCNASEIANLLGMALPWIAIIGGLFYLVYSVSKKDKREGKGMHPVVFGLLAGVAFLAITVAPELVFGISIGPFGWPEYILISFVIIVIAAIIKK